MLDLAKIRIDGGTQARAELNQSIVADYAEAYRTGVTMPPVVVFFDGATHWLADGFHRYFGAKDAGLDSIREEVTPGSLRDAILYSLKANETHGLRRTNADKRRAVETLLSDVEWAKWSSNEVAKRCAVSHTFVDNIRSSLATVASEESSDRVIKTKHGTTATMNTAHIGKKVAPVTPEVGAPAATETQSIPEQVQVVQEDSSPYDPQDDEIAGLHETVRSLADENDALKDQLLASDQSAHGTLAVAETIAGLRAEIKLLEVTISAITASRDSYQRDNAEMKIQMASQRKQIAKLQKVAA